MYKLEAGRGEGEEGRRGGGEEGRRGGGEEGRRGGGEEGRRGEGTGEERGTGHTYVELQYQVLECSVHLLVVYLVKGMYSFSNIYLSSNKNK